jgi:adenosine deaminase
LPHITIPIKRTTSSTYGVMSIRKEETGQFHGMDLIKDNSLVEIAKSERIELAYCPASNSNIIGEFKEMAIKLYRHKKFERL